MAIGFQKVSTYLNVGTELCAHWAENWIEVIANHEEPEDAGKILPFLTTGWLDDFCF